MAADAICIGGAWAFVAWGYNAFFGANYPQGPEFYLRMWPIVPAFVAVNALFRLYHGSLFYPSAPYSPMEEMRRLVGSAAIVHMGAIVVIVLMRQTMVGYSRVVTVISGLFVAILSQPLRDLARAAMARLGVGQIEVVVAGPHESAERVVSVLKSSSHIGFRPAAVVEDLRQIRPVAEKLGVRILVTSQDERFLRAQMSELSGWFRYIVYVPAATVFPIFGSRTVSLSGIGGVEMVNQGRMQLLRVEKWLLDKGLAVLAFVALLPFFVVIPVLVKLTSRGPVFYRQERLGWRGAPIKVWKFRSMYVDADRRLEAILSSDPAKRAEWNANFKLKDDPRVTPLGRFMRKTSIDEFPQLFNVFSGEMALVGPRPIVEKEVKYYGASYGIFSSVKPGVTGLWQATGRSDIGYARRVALDCEYVLNWSPWLDVWILFRTVYAVLFMRGAR